MKRYTPFALLALTGLMLSACAGNPTPPADTTKPTISLTAAPTTVSAAGVVTLNADAKDNVGVVKVTFYRGNTEIGSDITAPYEFKDNVTATQNGNVLYRAVATDAAGNSAESTATVTVNITTTPPPADTTKPTISLTAAPTTVSAAGVVTLNADAKDNVGVVKVTFYRGNTEIGSDITAPYEFKDNVTATQNGNVLYRAVATDAAGNSAESTATVTVNITTTPPPADTTKPTISLTAAPTTVSAAGVVTLNADAKDNVGVVKVTFYRGNTEIGSDITAPYEFKDNVTATQNGNVLYRAVATDAAGNSAESTATVTVNITTTPPPADTTPPAVSLSFQPTTLIAPGTVTFTATASDAQGVTSVVFYDNGILIATDPTAPYTASRTYGFDDNGRHEIRALAYDSNGNVGSSSAVLTVNIPDTNEPNDSVAAAKPLIIGTSFNGSIAGQARDMDYFKFNATAGDMLKLTVKSTSINPDSTLDPYVEILLPDGKTVLEKDDDSGAALESEIRFNVLQTGTYYVALTSFNIHDDAKATDNKTTNTYQIALTRR